MGAAIAALCNGRIQDYNWKRVACQSGMTIEKNKGQDLRHFPLEKARVQTTMPCTCIGATALIIYGWVLQREASLAGALVAIFFAALGVCGGSTSLANVLLDYYPEKPSSVTAASNITRCLLGAGATAVVNPMLEKMGPGWCFTLIGLVLFMSISLQLLLVSKGPTWREERRVRMNNENEIGKNEK